MAEWKRGHTDAQMDLLEVALGFEMNGRFCHRSSVIFQRARGTNPVVPADFARHLSYTKTFARLVGVRMVAWQIPLGNTVMPEMHNTWDQRRAGHDVTNPAPVDGNTQPSLWADDDGGYFKQQSAAYYRAGAVALP